MKRKTAFLLFLLASAALTACPDTVSHSRSVFLLLDTSGTYKNELDKARAIVNYLLGTLEPGDSLGVARIDTASFCEKDIVVKTTFDRRPSVSNAQKRLFGKKVDDFVASVKGSAYTDITGGILQAVEYLNETKAPKRFILIFSDLEEDLREGYVREFPIEVQNVNVVALNVAKLRSDNLDPRAYLERLDYWKRRVLRGGGRWRVMNDLGRLDDLLANQA